MITLTIDALGVATDTSLTLIPGQRYLFEWGDDITSGPGAGTLSLINDWTGSPAGSTAAPPIHKADGTAATWDLSSASSGFVEFIVAEAGIFTVSISSGTPDAIIYFALIPIPG